MFIRLFATTNNQKEAKKIFRDIISCEPLEISKSEIIKNEPYWKIENIFVVEAKIGFLTQLDTASFKIFLDNISDNWLFWGKPIEEALASAEKCNYIKDGINMINIFIEKDDLIE